MAKRLTPEEREARIRAYEEAKAARQAARAEKRKARIEAYEKAKAERGKGRREKKGVKVPLVPESTKVGQVKRYPTYKGEVKIGDELGFRWLGMAMGGILVEVEKSRNYRIKDDGSEENESGYVTYYRIQESSSKVFYPIKREDILAKKINGEWIDSCD